MAKFYFFIICVIASFISLSEQQRVLPYNQPFNPHVVNRIPLTKTILPDGKTIHYSIGQRYPGDYLVGHTVNNMSYRNLQDVQYNVWYPKNGVGDLVTYAEVWVEQNSHIGDAYITSGGIGQRSINILITAGRVTGLHYRAVVYARRG